MRIKGMPLDIKVLASVIECPKTIIQISYQCQSSSYMTRSAMDRLLKAGVVKEAGSMNGSRGPNHTHMVYRYDPSGWANVGGTSLSEVNALAAVAASPNPITIPEIHRKSSQPISVAYKSVYRLFRLNLLKRSPKPKHEREMGEKYQYTYDPKGWADIVRCMPVGSFNPGFNRLAGGKARRQDIDGQG